MYVPRQTLAPDLNCSQSEMQEAAWLRESLQMCHLQRPQREVCGHARVPAGAAGSGLPAHVLGGPSRDSWEGCARQHPGLGLASSIEGHEVPGRARSSAWLRHTPARRRPPCAHCTTVTGCDGTGSQRGTRSSRGYCATSCKSKIISKERARKRASLLWEKRTEMDQVKNKRIGSLAEGGQVGGSHGPRSAVSQRAP